MIEKEQKGLKLITLSLVLGTLLDKKEHLWMKMEKFFCWEWLKKTKRPETLVEGTLLGKIGPLRDEKEKNSL